MTNPGIALAKSHTFVSSYPRLTLGTGRIPRRRKSVFPTSPGILSWKGQTSSRLPFQCSPRCRPKEFLSHTLIAKNDQFVISWLLIFIEFTSDWAPETNRSKNPVPTSSRITQAAERRPSRNWKKEIKPGLLTDFLKSFSSLAGNIWKLRLVRCTWRLLYGLAFNVVIF